MLSSTGREVNAGENRVAIVSGAGTGVARTTASVLAHDGFAVALLGRRTAVIPTCATEER